LILRPQPYTAAEIEAVDVRIRNTTHPLQELFVFDDGRYISLLTGRGAGKTTAQPLRFIRRMVKQPDANCLFIAATRQSAERLIWRDLKRLLDKLRIRATFSEANLTCELRNGARLMLFGCDDKKDIQKLRGITYHEVGVDEVASINAELLRELIDEVIGPRMVGTLSLIGTPGKVLAGKFYDVTRPGSTFHRPYKDRELEEYKDWTSWSSHAWTWSG
jgi:phage terminase large subunit